MLRTVYNGMQVTYNYIILMAILLQLKSLILFFDFQKMGTQQENLPPTVIKTVAKELSNLSKDSIDGIKVQFDDSNLTLITIFVDGPGKYLISLSIYLIRYHWVLSFFFIITPTISFRRHTF